MYSLSLSLNFFFFFLSTLNSIPVFFLLSSSKFENPLYKKKLLEIKIELFQSYINLSTIKKKTYIIVNFKIHKINQDTRKLIRTFTLKKLKKLNYFISPTSPHTPNLKQNHHPGFKDTITYKCIGKVMSSLSKHVSNTKSLYSLPLRILQSM